MNRTLISIIFICLSFGTVGCSSKANNNTITIRLNDISVSNADAFHMWVPLPATKVTIIESRNGNVTPTIDDAGFWLDFTEGKRTPDRSVAYYEYSYTMELVFDKKKAEEWGIEFDGKPLTAFENGTTLELPNITTLINDLYGGNDSATDIPKDVDIEQFVVEQLQSFSKAASDTFPMKQVITEAVQGVEDMNNKEALARAIHQYVLQNFKYDNPYYEQYMAGTISQYKSVRDMLDNRTGICYQYARLTKMLLDYYGIENRLVRGNAFGDNEVYTEADAKAEKLNHEWNEIHLNGQWIPINTANNPYFGGDRYKNYYPMLYTVA